MMMVRLHKRVGKEARGDEYHFVELLLVEEFSLEEKHSWEWS